MLNTKSIDYKTLAIGFHNYSTFIRPLSNITAEDDKQNAKCGNFQNNYENKIPFK